MDDIVRITFNKSRSKKYKRAKVLAKLFPQSSQSGDTTVCSIATIEEYIKVQIDFFELLSIVENWKGSEIVLYGSKYESKMDLQRFQDKLYSEAGKYKIVLTDGGEAVSLGNVTYENLPLPFVYYPDHYGAFFAFSEDIGDEIYFCECEREAIENYIEIISQNTKQLANENLEIGIGYFPPIIKERMMKNKSNISSCIKYREKVCFRCNKRIPRLTYCHSMYGGQFMQHYGWYVQQEYFRQGTTPNWTIRGDALPEKCDPEIYDNFVRISSLNEEYRRTKADELRTLISSITKEHKNAIENSVRQQFGYKKIGESWVSETIMFHILERLYPNIEIIRHYRPDWLEGLELDAFIPDLNMGFEYQGIQHFKAVDHWGGEAQLAIQKEHDERKMRICKRLGVKLICIDYDEPLTEDYISNRIATDI